jgi:hypothetical protein
MKRSAKNQIYPLPVYDTQNQGKHSSKHTRQNAILLVNFDQSRKADCNILKINIILANRN